MPKIIENAEKLILQEARRQVTEQGYSAVTVRSVAKACRLAVGTIYNYFPSKEMLVAAFMLEDWRISLSGMRARANAAGDPRELLQGVFEGLAGFIRDHEVLFRDPGAGVSSAASFASQHAILRGQLEDLLREPLRRLSGKYTELLPAFLAESLLTWAGGETDFGAVYGILKNLF